MGVHMHALSVEAGSQCWVSHSVTLCHIVLAWDLSLNWWCGNSASLAAGNCTRVLTLVWQTLYWLSHLPSPKICILILVFFLCSPSQYLCLCCVCDRLLLVTRSWEDKQKEQERERWQVGAQWPRSWQGNGATADCSENLVFSITQQTLGKSVT